MGVVITRPRIVPAWLAAAKHLELHGREFRNIVLEVEDPRALPEEDRAVLDQVDLALQSNAKDLSIRTVATTIFPQALYERYGPDAFAARFLAIMKRAAYSCDRDRPFWSIVTGCVA